MLTSAKLRLSHQTATFARPAAVPESEPDSAWSMLKLDLGSASSMLKFDLGSLVDVGVEPGLGLVDGGVGAELGTVHAEMGPGLGLSMLEPDVDSAPFTAES